MRASLLNTLIVSGALVSIFLITGLGYYLLVPASEISIAQKEETPAPTDPFANIELEAKAVVVYDPETNQVLFAKNQEAQLPIASLTKVMTALVASELLLDNTRVPITDSALATYGDNGLKPGEQWKLRDLIDFMLVSSSNDGAAAIAESVSLSRNTDFVALMNQKARELNLTQSYFLNETGLDQDDYLPGSLSSALDIAKLFSHVLKTRPDLLAATRQNILASESLNRNRYTVTNTNDIVGQIPGVLASKTGYTATANGNLAVAFDRGLRQPVVVVVLGSSQQGRFRDMEKLIAAAFALR